MPETHLEAASRTVDISFSEGEFVAGVKLLSYLVHPKTGPQEEQERLRIERAIGFEALRRAGEMKHLCAFQISTPLHYISQPETERARALRKVDTELKRRFVAARIAKPFLGQVAFKIQADLEAKGRTVPLTIKRFSERYQDDAGESEATNVQSRAWRPSFPVLHIAVALEVLVSTFRELSRYALSVFEHTLAPGFAKRVLAGSQEAAKLIALAPKLQGAANQLIHFRAT